MSINSQETFYSRLGQLFEKDQQYKADVFKLLFEEKEIEGLEKSKVDEVTILKLRQIADKYLQRTEEGREVTTILKMPLELRFKVKGKNTVLFPDKETAPKEDRTDGWWKDFYIWEKIVFTEEKKVDIYCKHIMGPFWPIFEGMSERVTFPKKKNEIG